MDSKLASLQQEIRIMQAIGTLIGNWAKYPKAQILKKHVTWQII